MHEANHRQSEVGLYGQRKSRCADAARELHMERTWMLSPIERIRLSLSLGRRLPHLIPGPLPTNQRG